MKHLERLCVGIGPRPVGSKGNQAAADYIRRAFEATGLEVEMQEFLCPLWEKIETQLEVGGEKLPAFANTWSPSCDVVAPAVALGTVAELEAAELADRVGVLYGDLTKGHGIGPRSAFYFPEEHQKIVRLLEEKGPAALLAVNPQVGNLERLICDWEFPIPSVTVPAEAGLTLLRHSDRPLHLRIESSQVPRAVLPASAPERPGADRSASCCWPTWTPRPVHREPMTTVPVLPSCWPWPSGWPRGSWRPAWSGSP